MTRISKPRKRKRPWLWIVLAIAAVIFLVISASWIGRQPYVGPVYPSGAYAPGVIPNEQPGETSNQNSAPAAKDTLPGDE